MSLLMRSRMARVPNFLRICQSRNTWVFRHIMPPPVVKPNESQRRPDDLLNLMKLEVIREPKDQEQHTVKVILLEDVEGVGHQFDILEFDHNHARDNLLLPKKAVYASPFDLKYYADMKERMKEELAARVRVPFDYIKLQRKLKQKVIAIHVSMDNPWTIDPSILQASLFESGIVVPVDSIILAEKYAYSGPNFDLEAADIHFELRVNKEYNIPAVGKVTHI